MALDIFTFEPDLIEPREYSSTWKTTVTGFDSGTNQYQPEYSRQIKGFRFTCRDYHEVSLRFNAIEAFFDNHKGMGYPFYLPSWRAETVLTVVYTSGVYLYVGNIQFFSSISGKPGNLIHIKHPNGSPEEVRKIIAITEETKKLTIDSALANGYPVNSTIQIAYQVRFAQDSFKVNYSVGYDIFETTLDFGEDL
jgi:hypothetical protein